MCPHLGLRALVMGWKSLEISHFEKLLVMLIAPADVGRDGAIRSLAAASGISLARGGRISRRVISERNAPHRGGRR